MKSTREQLVDEVNDFMREFKMSTTGLASRAVGRNYNDCVTNLLDGRDVKTGTMDKLREFMAKHRKMKEYEAGLSDAPVRTKRAIRIPRQTGRHER